jgi:Na+/proline symporter
LIFMITYSVISGFRAIVATEQWQFRFVVAAVAVLVLMVLMLAFGGEEPVPVGEIAAGLLHTWAAPWAFVLGIICMNLPAPFADAATWQRLCATRSEDDARRGLGNAVPWFILIWGGLIVCASLISGISAHTAAFDPAKGTLMSHLMTTLAQGGGLRLTLLFLFVLGLFSAMITTADSLLLVSAQMFVQDLRRIQPSKDAAANALGLRTARTAIAVIGLLSFGVFALFQWLQFDVVQLIFAIYGAHIALFPAVFAALFLKRYLRLEKAWLGATLSTTLGFIAGWVSALVGKNTGKTDWLYNAPAVSLIVATVLFLVLTLPHWKRRTTE